MARRLEPEPSTEPGEGSGTLSGTQRARTTVHGYADESRQLIGV